MNELSRLTCQELVELVTDYLEGTLPEAARRSFEAHLSDCHNCDGFFHQMRFSIRLTGTLSGEMIPPAIEQELLELFRRWKHEHDNNP